LFNFRHWRFAGRLCLRSFAQTSKLLPRKRRPIWLCVLPSALGLSLFSSQALAQAAPPIPVPAGNTDFLNLLSPAPTAGATSIQPPSQQYSVEYQPIRIGPWEITPSLFSGMAYNDNLYGRPNNKVGDAAWRVTPTLMVVNDSGINRFTYYALVDSLTYLRYGQDDTVNGRVGLTDRWEIDRDLVFRVFGDLSRQTDLGSVQNYVSGQNYGSDQNYGSGQNFGNAQNNSRPTFLPLHYWQYETGGSLVKSFDRLFIGASSTFTKQLYDNLGATQGPPISESYQNNNQSFVTGRVGYFLGPAIYTFVDTSGNQQTYQDASHYNSKGYRVVGGLGADPLSLFKGEIYAGYQRQYFAEELGGAQGGAAFGGNVSWLPTQYLTVGVNLDQALSTSIASSPITSTTASATKTTAAGLSVDYALSQTWSANGHVNFAKVSYDDSLRFDHDAAAGLTFNWKIKKNLNATLDYQLNRISSNYLSAGYTQNVVSVGLTYLP